MESSLFYWCSCLSDCLSLAQRFWLGRNWRLLPLSTTHKHFTEGQNSAVSKSHHTGTMCVLADVRPIVAANRNTPRGLISLQLLLLCWGIAQPDFHTENKTLSQSEAVACLLGNGRGTVQWKGKICSSRVAYRTGMSFFNITSAMPSALTNQHRQNKCFWCQYFYVSVTV